MNKDRGTEPAIHDSYDSKSHDDDYDDRDDESSEDTAEEDDLTKHLKRLKAYDTLEEPPSRFSDPKTQHAPQRSQTIEPLYIGVPVAGACVLMAIIIFAIYILKRHNQYLEEHNRRKAASLKQQGLIYVGPPPDLSRGQSSGKVCIAKNTCLYPECDRSSNGSETRLLMKV